MKTLAAILPEDSLLRPRICVAGKVSSYKGKPQIEAKEPDQLKGG